MKKLTILLLFCTLTLTAFTQVPTISRLSFKHKNSVQVELGGHGVFYSVNYERVILNGQRFKTTAQAGGAYYPPQTGVIDLWLPVLINELFTFNRHHFELGIGHVFVNESHRGFNNEVVYRHWTGFLTGRIGYRYQKPDGRFILRAAFTPMIEYREDDPIHPLVGLAIGYAFGR